MNALTRLIVTRHQLISEWRELRRKQIVLEIKMEDNAKEIEEHHGVVLPHPRGGDSEQKKVTLVSTELDF